MGEPVWACVSWRNGNCCKTATQKKNGSFLRDSLVPANSVLPFLERPADAGAQAQLVVFGGYWRTTIVVVPEGQGKVKIIGQFNDQRIIGGGPNAAKIG